MDPPFYSARQALGFAALIFLLLVLPVGLAKTGLVERKHVYPSVPEEWGGYGFIQKQIFVEKADIDLLVVTTSQLYQGLDGNYLQRQLTQGLGREAVLVVFPTNYRCEALVYTLLRDVLKRRKVKAVMLSAPFANNGDSLPHLQSYRWYLYGEDFEALEGLPARYRWTFHAQVVLGASRHLLSLVRQDRLDSASAYMQNFGTVKIERINRNRSPFVHFSPTLPALTPDEMILAVDSPRVRFPGPQLNDYQHHYTTLSMNLLRQQRIPLIMLHLPVWVNRHDTVVNERMPWPQVFNIPITLIGVAPATLFAGLTEEEINKLYYNNYDWPNHHLNRNGSEYYTRVITPAILEAYARNVIAANSQ